MENKWLIKTLKKERRKLYPYGLPVQPRGCGKPTLYLAHFLRYIAYDFVCNTYKKMDKRVSLEEAHKDMEDFINEMWSIKQDF